MNRYVMLAVGAANIGGQRVRCMSNICTERTAADGRRFLSGAARSDQKFDIPREEAILPVPLASSVAVPNSCREYVCGRC
jgi:hypothetical protein